MSISLAKTIRVKAHGEEYVEVPLLAFYPDFEPDSKFRGYAIIPNIGQVEPDGGGVMIDDTKKYLRVEELQLHLEDRRALLLHSLKELDSLPVILDEAVNEVVKTGEILWL